MLLQHLRTMHAYNAWAHDRVWRCIERLDDEEFTRDIGYSLGSVRNQVVHVMSVDMRWFTRLARQPLSPHLEAATFTGVLQTRQRWNEIATSNTAVLNALDDESILAPLEYDMPHRGGIKRNTPAEILLHVYNHGTDHRAQILAMLHQLGAPTVEQDLMFYLWQRDEAP